MAIWNSLIRVAGLQRSTDKHTPVSSSDIDYMKAEFLSTWP